MSIHHPHLRAHAAARGMTLIEIMIVIAIISLVLGGVGIVAFRAYTEAQLKTAHTRAVQLVQAVDMYRSQHRGRCPPTVEAMRQSGVIQNVPIDPWGSKYSITCEERTPPVVVSAGPDRELGNEDDITNEKDPTEQDEEEQEV